MSDRTTRLFLRSVQFENGKLFLDRAHKKKLLKVLRLEAGDLVVIQSPDSKWECRISDAQNDGLLLDPVRELPAPPPQKCQLILGQAIPKGERFDWLIQKATELGVAEIFPLITERTIVRPTHPDAKLQRWNEIADQAAAQCEGAYPTFVHAPVTLEQFAAAEHTGLRILLHEREGFFPLKSLLENVRNSRITFVVGPEGGWTAAETDLLSRAGFTRVQLGSRILRSETAGLVLAAILQYSCGDFSD